MGDEKQKGGRQTQNHKADQAEAESLFEIVPEHTFRAWEAIRSTGKCNMFEVQSLFPDVFTDEVVNAIITGDNYDALIEHYGTQPLEAPAPDALSCFAELLSK